LKKLFTQGKLGLGRLWRGGDREIGRWGDGEMGRWRNIVEEEEWHW
jgi:hypothetical protein